MLEKINIGEFSLATKIDGQPKKGHILLIHCLGLSHKVFEDQINFLSEQGFEVIAPDMRSHGDSDKVDRECTLDDITEDVEKLIKKLGIRKFFALGGISMGGMISMRLVLKNPELTDNLILMGTSADEDPYKDRYKIMIEDLLNSIKAEKNHEKLHNLYRNSAELLVRLCFSQQYLEKNNNFERWVLEAMKSQGVGGIYVAIAVINRKSIINKIHKIKCRTLIMAGELDMAVPPNESKKIAERIENSKLILLDGAPHIFTPEIPVKVNQHLKEFLLSSNNFI